MRQPARPDLWEAWVGNHPGPPGKFSAAPTLAPQAVLARRYLGVFSSHLGWPSASGQMVMSTGTCVTDTSSWHNRQRRWF